LTGSGRTGPVAGLAPGLVARVQRRLAATGASATDAAGLRAAVEETLVEDGVVLPAVSLSAIVRSIGDELTGLGPLAPLLADPTVTDVLVNGPADVWVERGGTIERAPVRFASAAAVAALVQRVVAPLGLRVDESRPWVDARLPGGERFHAVLPPLAPDGPVVTIRAFARRRLQLRDLIERGALDVATALAAGGDGRRRDRHRRVRRHRDRQDDPAQLIPTTHLRLSYELRCSPCYSLPQRPQDDVEAATVGTPSRRSRSPTLLCQVATVVIGANGTVVLSVWHRPAHA